MNFSAGVFFVGLGSALGGVARYLIGLALASRGGFPWATLTVNVLGSLMIGILSGFLAKSSCDDSTLQYIRCFAVVGFCGGFTTFSTFSNETFRMLESSQLGLAAAYAAASLLAGILSVFLGYYLSR